ncbi:hypothetical protein SAMN02910292_00794 [Lachnospiraceae bacterium XBB2008]|nr:hypothetical protein SAMN02910292_00794 [Lachnospiraceae bacterium XBB2008]
MERSDGRQRIGELLYLIYFVLMIGARAIGLYEGQFVLNAIYVVAMLLFAAHMIVTKHTIPEYGIALGLLLIAGIVYLHTGEKGLLICFVTLLGMKGVEKQKVILCGMVTAGLCIGFRIFTGAFGLLPELFYPQDRGAMGVMFRHSLGYAHPNTLHMNVLLLTMLIGFYITSRNNSVTVPGTITKILQTREALTIILVSALLVGLNLYVFMYSGSRTGVLVSLVYLCVNLWFYLRRSPGIFEKIVCFAAYPVAVFIAIAFPFILPDGLFDRLDNSVFNTRLSIAGYFWSNNSLSLFGIRLNNPDPLFKAYGLDMAHLYLLLQLGIAAFATVTVITFLYVRHALKRGYMAELAVLMAVLFAGVWEPFLYNAGFKNITFVFMGAALYEMVSGTITKVLQNDDSRNNSVTVPDTTHATRGTVVAIAAGLLAGVIAAGAFLVLTDKPQALYMDTQEDEAGDTLGLEPLYLTQAEIDDIRSSGDMVVRYTDENTPMYKYDADAAVPEYNKKAVSIGVWFEIFTTLICISIQTVIAKIQTNPEAG